jgi:HD-GYP domain-containing protein (c-di-GMP phosphodiesterase class II)
LLRRHTEMEWEATISLFRELEATGVERAYPPSGWEGTRKVTSILVDAATPKDGYTARHALEVARLSGLVGMDLGFDEEGLE